MRSTLVLAAIAASVSTTSAAIQGFNYGAAKTDGSFMFEADYKSKFAAAKSLPGASGFSSARLYTMIQGGSSTNEPTQAIPAAIAEGTSLLLGLWASGGQGVLEAEITALKSAISQYGDDFTKLVVGISVGNEDLYRISPTGIAALSGYGAEPDTLVSYIGQVRTAIEGTSLSDAQIGHVDTWTAWVNSSNNAVAEACDWIGFDAYPYFQNSMANSISDGKALFNDALAATKAAVGGKPVWITETGWPVSGKTENLGIPSTENAQTYWEEVGCPLFGVTNTWWFTLQDSDPSVPNPSFGIVGTDLKPLFDLSCNAVASSSSSSAPASSSTIPTTPKSSSSSIAPTSSTDSAVPTTAVSSTAVSSTASTATTDSGAAISSGASSLSSEAAVTTGIASSGGGLSPSQGGGIVVSSGGAASATSTSTPTGSTGNGTTSAGSTAISTSSPSSTSIVPVTPGNSAAIQSGSFVAAIGAFIAAFVAL